MNIRIPPNTFGHLVHSKKKVENVAEVTNFSSAKLEYTDLSKHGEISQLVNNQYLFELKKGIKKVLIGRRLENFLNRKYKVSDLEGMPTPRQNLIVFAKEMKNSKVTQFIEFWDESHEIRFKDLNYFFDLVRFRALFGVLGKLFDVQMKTGTNDYVSLSKDFDIRKKIEELFEKLIDRKTFFKSLIKRRRKKRKKN